MIKEKEGQRIVDKYLRETKGAILYGTIINNIVQQVIEHLGNFERPDMLSYYDNTIIGIEHFEFDSSDNIRKGSKYQIENAKINNKFDKIVEKELSNKKEIIIHDDIKIKTSLKNYYSNFEKQFLNHYKNIDAYIDNIKTSFKCENKNIDIWFFAEDTSLLGNYYFTKNDDIRMLHPLYSDHNIELFKKSKKIKGLIFGSYSGSQYKLFIICNNSKSITKFINDKPDVKSENFFNFEPHTTGFALLVDKKKVESNE